MLNTVNELKNFARVRLALSNLNCAVGEINAKFDLNLKSDDFILVKKRFLGFRSNKIFNFNLRRVIARESDTVFYARHLKTAAYLLAHKKPSQKVVFEAHECFASQNPSARELEKMALSNCDFYVFHNASTRDELAKIYGITFLNSAVAYNGVKLPEMQSAPSKHFKFDEIAYFGSFIAWKGVDLLLDLLARDSNLKLFLYGDDKADSARSLKNQIAERGLEGRARFMGRLSQAEVVKELTKNERILILPNKKSEYSNFSVPIKIFEYLGTCNLVFAPSFAPFREVVRDGENGFLYEPENIDALASLLETVSQKSADELNSVANAGRESVKNFTWAARARAIATALKSAFGDDNSNLKGEA